MGLDQPADADTSAAARSRLDPCDAVLVPLQVDDVEFLRHCLHNQAQRWRDAITEADAGANRIGRKLPAAPGHLDAEPTPAGYQALGRLFREQLARVEQLGHVLDEVVRATVRSATDDLGPAELRDIASGNGAGTE